MGCRLLTSVFLVLFTVGSGFRLGLYDSLPYSHTTKDSISFEIFQKAAHELDLDFSIVKLKNETQGIDCVKTENCDAVITSFVSDISLSYPLFYVAFI